MTPYSCIPLTLRRRKEEERINALPNFKAHIEDDDGNNYNIHFAALFSSKPDATPIAFLHGWPGSFLEFVPLMEHLKQKYSPDNLPYHIIAPSLPGYALSSDPPHDKDWTTIETGRLIHKVMLSLGFAKNGYLVQGGDIGSMVSRVMAATYDECKGMHLNFMLNIGIKDKASDDDKITEQEKKGLERMDKFFAKGRAYANEHGTKPATIGFVMASSPIAQLAWIGVSHQTSSALLSALTYFRRSSSPGQIPAQHHRLTPSSQISPYTG
jgi:microsomal epoxide hydrolase